MKSGIEFESYRLVSENSSKGGFFQIGGRNQGDFNLCGSYVVPRYGNA
jgi:hypothetical protein